MKGSPLLDGGPVGRAFRAELLRGEGSPSQPVAARRGADVIDRVAHPRRLAPADLVVAERSQAQGVHERVSLVGSVKVDVAADRRDPDAVAIVGNPGDHAPQEPLGRGRTQVAKAQGIGEQDRPGPHRENVADDPAHPGRRALKRLDCARVVVRLDLEGDRPAVAYVDDARVLLAGLDEHAPEPGPDMLLLGGKPLQQGPRVLVGAVLRPHDREDPQLGQGRIPAQRSSDPRLLVGEQSVLIDERGRDRLV